MKEFLKRLKAYWLPWVVLSFAIVLFSYFALGEFLQWYSLRVEINSQEEEIEEATKRIDRAVLEVEEVSDPIFLEKEARARLNLKREGEEVFIVVGLESITKEENFGEIYTSSVERQGKIWLNIKSWVDYFFRSS